MPGYFENFRIDFKDQHKQKISTKEQAEHILTKVSELVKQGNSKVGITYSANRFQSLHITNCYKQNEKITGITGANQADVMANVEALLKKTENAFLKEAFFILPISTCAKSGGLGSVKDEWLNEELKNISTFIDQGGVVLGWQNQVTIRNKEKPYAIGGGTSKKLTQQQIIHIQSYLMNLHKNKSIKHQDETNFAEHSFSNPGAAENASTPLLQTEFPKPNLISGENSTAEERPAKDDNVSSDNTASLLKETHIELQQEVDNLVIRLNKMSLPVSLKQELLKLIHSFPTLKEAEKQPKEQTLGVVNQFYNDFNAKLKEPAHAEALKNHTDWVYELQTSVVRVCIIALAAIVGAGVGSIFGTFALPAPVLGTGAGAAMGSAFGVTCGMAIANRFRNDNHYTEHKLNQLFKRSLEKAEAIIDQPIEISQELPKQKL